MYVICYLSKFLPRVLERQRERYQFFAINPNLSGQNYVTYCKQGSFVEEKFYVFVHCVEIANAFYQ